MKKKHFLWSGELLRQMELHVPGKAALATALLCLGVGTDLYAQQRTKITFSSEKTNFKEVIKEIEKQTDYDLIYNSNLLPNTKFALDAQAQDVKQVLNELCSKFNVEYTIKNNVITLRPKQNKKQSSQPKQTEIKGVVTDESGIPLPGVSVKVKGTSQGVSTDLDGKFTLRMSDEQQVILAFSMIGMDRQEQKVKDMTKELHVTMRESTNYLNEVVKIGYADMAQKDVTGSISTFDTKIIESSAAPTITAMMQGQIPGLSIQMGDGTPGSSAKLEIRGASSLSGDSSPLIVIDDVPMGQDYDLNMLNPQDVQSLNVLKGASATAIYGSRASGGVIMITTKGGGRNQKPVINYSYNFSKKQLVSDIRTLTADEYKMLLLEAARNEARALGYEDLNEYSQYKNYMAPGYFGEANTNWMNELMQDATTQQHNISIRGAGQNMSYNASLGYVDEEGMIKSLYSRRYTWSAGINSDINKKLKADIKASGSFGRTNKNVRGMDIAIYGRPDTEVYNEDGSYHHQTYTYGGTVSTMRNPLAEVLETKDLENTTNLSLSAGLNWFPLPGLNISGRYSFQRYSSDEDQYYGRDTFDGSDGFKYTYNGKGRRTNYVSNTQEIEGRINYSKTFKRDHYLSVMGAATLNDVDTERYWFEMINYGDDDVQNGIWQATEPNDRNWHDGSALGSVMLSFLGRLEYKYKNRYILTGTVRTDSSSKFSPNHRWGTFPSFAAAWIVSEEKFVKDNLPWLSFFKIKGGWGKVGNGWVDYYGWRTMFDTASYEGNPGIIPSQIGNDELRWEGTNAWDIGFEFGILDNKIRGEFGYYHKKTDGLLYDMSLAPSTGLDRCKVNYANIENRGVEFNVTANIINTRDWSWQVSGNISKNKNKVTNIDADLVSQPGYAFLTNTIIMEGKSLGLIYGHVTDGVFRSQEEIDYYESLNKDHNYQTGSRNQALIPGDLKYVDLNGDGWVNIDKNNKDDKAVLGCSRPDFEGGLSTSLGWKGLTLSIQSSFAFGHEKYWAAFGNQYQFNSAEPNNVMDMALNRWTPENPESKYPCMRLNKYMNEYTDFCVFDASYWKIQNVNLDYRLPQIWINKTKIFSNVIVSASVNNVYTFTDYPGPSPESFSSNMIQGNSIDYSTYPQSRSFNFGIKVTLK